MSKGFLQLMTDNNHPITPPPELVTQWSIAALGAKDWLGGYDLELIATQAANWGADQQLHLDAEQIKQAWQKGADQELEACCEWLVANDWKAVHKHLRSARRPKPPSLKDKALLQLDTLNADLAMHGMGCDLSQIRRAIESLPS